MKQEMFYKVSAIIEMTGLSRSKVYQMITDGEIPAIRLGERTIRIPKEAFDNWLSGLDAFSKEAQ
ncbi:helix-turn-helix domain-containing protein [Schinkia azotoformans]|uniref:helix-turn-helix transcriptional regulator n=1 Tax=Schinkia azotoformans TaxID=1454 RepID=UPI002DBC47A3|nr:helix-turn-helix domain-containing protein [Schinkia azotoformans]MEC1778328.1 helix-turn-helix domain-containing protein [Schinkia azotoformans]MED4331965.1 helix-turn-helix domain-containing protein [Schinkia azotoformans]